jgi:hypothetical protein
MSVSVAGTTSRAGLLLVALGSPQEQAGLTAIAARLAEGEPLSLRQVGQTDDPDAALTALTAEATGPWLAALPLDPGLPLARGGSWAEALGAWRQPCLLVLSEAQMATGLPAAGEALLQRWRVPLVGLLQVGGEWRPLERRRDGLPWLGWLPATAGEDGESMQAVRVLLRSRWRGLPMA